MSVMDEIVQAINDSAKLHPAIKPVLTEFLQAAGPAIALLAPAELQSLLARFASGDAAAATSLLGPGQVVASLDATQQAMDAEVQKHASEAAASHAVMAAFQNAALSILAKLVIAAL